MISQLMIYSYFKLLVKVCNLLRSNNILLKKKKDFVKDQNLFL